MIVVSINQRAAIMIVLAQLHQQLRDDADELKPFCADLAIYEQRESFIIRAAAASVVILALQDITIADPLESIRHYRSCYPRTSQGWEAQVNMLIGALDSYLSESHYFYGGDIHAGIDS